MAQNSTAVVRTFTVNNTGTATLTTSGLALPSGFSLVEGLSASIAAGGSDTFQVRLDTTSAGTKSGQISFTTNDSDENPFNFSIGGIVNPPPPPSGPTPIETSGATTLARSANQFYLLDSTGAGPTLKFQGSDGLADRWAGWAPIGAEKTSNGYEVAWKMSPYNQYEIWNTDSNGNFTSLLISGVQGSDPALQAQEALFHQDLNGDGHISGAQMAAANVAETSPAAISHSDVHYDLLL